MTDYHSFSGHGVDVAVNRTDALDKQALQYIQDHPGCRVLDVGSGAGGQADRMAAAGATVVGLDSYDFAEQFVQYGHSREQLQFVQGDMKELLQLLPCQKFDIAVAQRVIHYLRYTEAQQFLRDLRTIVRDRLYISVTGIGSLVGDSYLATDQPLKDRFSILSELGQEMFSITEPVCLYSETEFRQLITDAGWQIDSCRVTAFGNIQAICNNLM